MTTRHLLVSILAVFFATLMTSSVEARVWVVAQSGPRDFDEIKPAVEAAASGDTILIRDGKYFEVPIEISKSLTLIEQQGTRARYQGGLFVRNLAPTDVVVIRGLHLPYGTLVCEDNEGEIWVEGCELEYGRNPGFGTATFINCSRVTMTHSTVIGAPGVSALDEPAEDALYAENSAVTLYSCTLEGGFGDVGGPDCCDQPAGDACVFKNNRLFASGCQFQGGDGGDESGGHGLWRQGDAIVHQLGSTFQGGSGNPPGMDINGGGVNHLAGEPKSYRIDATGIEGTPLKLTFEGIVGDLVLLHPVSYTHLTLPTILRV